MNCPKGHHVSYTMDSSAWGGPLSQDIHDRRLRTYYPCLCEQEIDPIPWRDVPAKRETP